jgi:hypothetical protein
MVVLIDARRSLGRCSLASRDTGSREMAREVCVTGWWFFGAGSALGRGVCL